METDRLRQFCVIVETGSLSRAAQMLGISHSGLSKSIATLETELGLSLFQPRGRGLELTEAGRELLPRAQELLRQVQIFQAHKAPSKERTLKIGMLEVFINGVTENMMNQPLRILELAPGEIEHEVQIGNLDFGVTFLPRPTAGVEHLKLGKLKMGVLAKKGVFEDTPFIDVPFVVPFSSSRTSDPLGPKERDGWPDSLAPRNKRFEVNLMSAAFSLASKGFCAIFAPVYLADKYGLAMLKTPANLPSLDREVWLVKKNEAIESRDSKTIAAMIRRLCNARGR